MKSQIQAFFRGDNIRQLLDCDQAFIEHCNRLSYWAEASSDHELVSPTMGRTLLEIALGFCELAHGGSSDKSLDRPMAPEPVWLLIASGKIQPQC
jgi:hypothetical protein